MFSFLNKLKRSPKADHAVESDSSSNSNNVGLLSAVNNILSHVTSFRSRVNAAVPEAIDSNNVVEESFELSSAENQELNGDFLDVDDIPPSRELEVESPLAQDGAFISETIEMQQKLTEIDETAYFERSQHENYVITKFIAEAHKPSNQGLHSVMPNEDYVDSFRTKNGKLLNIVLDGMSQSNESSMFVTRFVDKLKEYVAENEIYTEEQLIKCLNTILMSFDKKYLTQTPGATCSMTIQLEGNEWLYFAIGDSIIVRKKPDESYEKLNHEQIKHGSTISSFLQPGVELTKDSSREEDDDRQLIHEQNIGTVTLEPGESLLLASDGVNNMVDSELKISKLTLPSIDEHKRTKAEYETKKPAQDGRVMDIITTELSDVLSARYESEKMNDNVSFIHIDHSSNQEAKAQESSSDTPNENPFASPELILDADHVAALRLKQSNTGVRVLVVRNLQGDLAVRPVNHFEDFTQLPAEFDTLFEELKTQIELFNGNSFKQTMLLMKFNNNILNLPIIPEFKSDLVFTESVLSEMKAKCLQKLKLSVDDLNNPEQLASIVEDFTNYLYTENPDKQRIALWLKKNLSESFLSTKQRVSIFYQFADSIGTSYPLPDDLSKTYGFTCLEDLLVSDELVDLLLVSEDTNKLVDLVSKYKLVSSFESALACVSLSRYSKLNEHQWRSLVVNSTKVICGIKNKADVMVDKKDVNKTLSALIRTIFDSEAQVPDQFLKFMTKHIRVFASNQRNIEFLLQLAGKLDYSHLYFLLDKSNNPQFYLNLVEKKLLSEIFDGYANYADFYKVINKIGFHKLNVKVQEHIITNFDVSELEIDSSQFDEIDANIQLLLSRKYLDIDFDYKSNPASTCESLGLTLDIDEHNRLVVFNGENNVTDKYQLSGYLNKLEEKLLDFESSINSVYLQVILRDAESKAFISLEQSGVETQVIKAGLFSRWNRSAIYEQERGTDEGESFESESRFSRWRSKFTNLSNRYFTRKRLAVLTPLIMFGGYAAWYMIFKETPDTEALRAVVDTAQDLIPTSSDNPSFVSTVAEAISNRTAEFTSLLTSVPDIISNVADMVNETVSKLPLANDGANVLVDSIVQNYTGTHIELTQPSDYDWQALSDIYTSTSDGYLKALSENSNIQKFSAKVMTESGRLLARTDVGDLVKQGTQVMGQRNGSMIEFTGNFKLFRVMIDGQPAIIKYFQAVDGNYFAGTHLSITPASG